MGLRKRDKRWKNPEFGNHEFVGTHKKVEGKRRFILTAVKASRNGKFKSEIFNSHEDAKANRWVHA